MEEQAALAVTEVKDLDGISEGLYQEAGEPVLDPNIYNPWEPDIEVEYFGCTNSMVTVSTNATGNINWIFGFGAEPMNSENQQDTVFYSSPTGYRSITLIAEGVPYFYGNYVEIRDELTLQKLRLTAPPSALERTSPSELPHRHSPTIG